MSVLEDFAIDQARRLISVEDFGLGVKKIMVMAFEGREELSSLARFRLEIVSLGRPLKPSEVLGQKLTIALRAYDKIRKISGVISRFEAMHSSVRNLFLHSIELVPPAWRLALNQRFRTFHDMKATDIVRAVAQESGVSLQSKSVGDSREYTVQYGESDLSFIMRLLEEEGVYFRFAFDDAQCPMVLGDGAADYKPLSPETLKLEHDVTRWQPHYFVGSSTFKHADWDFKAVSVMEGNAKGLAQAQPPGLAGREFFEFPGGFDTTEQGRKLAVARMEEQEGRFVSIAGSTNDLALFAGAKFKIDKHAVDLPASGAQADTYVLVHIDHFARDYSETPFDSGGDGKHEYRNDFVCMPATFNFRPARVTPKPVIRGPQTATVIDGPDNFGRAKVKFPWAPNENSCWMRVAQSWAFNQMGTQFLPRINSEVVVEFLDGDPDRPIIVGMVYNGKNKLPYSLPANKTQSGVRGANWDSAGTNNKSNELRFEDKSGSEEIFLHAQKDFRRVVANNDALTVEEGNRKIDIKKGNVSETLDMGNYDLRLKQGDVTETLDMGGHTLKLKMGDFTETLDLGNHSTKVSVGNHEIKAALGTSKVEALQSITLKVGANSITVDQMGVSIKGLMVKIEGQVMLDLKGVMTTVNGNGMLTLKGAITMVN